MLLKQRVNINYSNSDGRTLLYLAAQKGHESTVRLLIGMGANVNKRERNGTSPLDISVQNSSEVISQMLRENGATSGKLMLKEKRETTGKTKKSTTSGKKRGAFCCGARSQ